MHRPHEQRATRYGEPTVHKPARYQPAQFFLSTKTAGPPVLWCTACSRSTREIEDRLDGVEDMKRRHRCGPVNGDWS
ncbi:MAG TPA: hypothetical protein VK611_15560 [Acidimicrobiales bacterium]|nr:hypothetical protein [Acidimicrobiales bacterium]